MYDRATCNGRITFETLLETLHGRHMNKTAVSRERENKRSWAVVSVTETSNAHLEANGPNNYYFVYHKTATLLRIPKKGELGTLCYGDCDVNPFIINVTLSFSAWSCTRRSNKSIRGA
jgi:hypothetical protein